ncbi:MAG: HYR domain-containing protein [Gelidibacter sp.]
MKRTLLFPIVCCITFLSLQAQITPGSGNILYVNKSVSGGTGSGNSWANAIPELADALKYAKQQDNYTAGNPLKLYVAVGTYQPMYTPATANFGNNGGRNNSFLMVNNVQLYGGFDPANGIVNLSDDRIVLDESANTGSILDGNLGVVGTQTDNTFHVVMAVGDVGVARLDGFTVMNGYADGYGQFLDVNGESTVKDYGGGIYNFEDANTSYANLVVTNNEATNSGGGFYIRTSGPTISHSFIIDNTANLGGGILNFFSTSSVVLDHVKFQGNMASGYGGAISSASTGPMTLINVGLFENTSPIGASIYINNTDLTFLNVTSGGNSSSGIRWTNTDVTLSNTILWDALNVLSGATYSAQNSLIQLDSSTSNGNIDGTLYTSTDIFKDSANGDFSLKSNSPTVNRGSNTAYTNGGGDLANDLDLAGNPRLVLTSIDMGAYEAADTMPTAVCTNYTAQLDANGLVTITPEDVNGGSTDAETNLTLSIDIDTFDCDTLGDTMVTLTVEDETGNIDTCTATITVEDTMAPQLSCPSDQNVDADSGNDTYMVPDFFDTGMATVTDNCSATTITRSQTPEVGAALEEGNYTVTLTAMDASGNTDTCDFQLTVTSTLGLADLTPNLNTITLYPIPTKNVLNIRNPQNLQLNRLVIYDLNGRRVQTTNLEGLGTEQSIPVNELQSAVYVVRIISREGILTKRLVKD